MPNNDDQLQQQYQEILNKYASSITPPEQTTPPVETIADSPKVEELIPTNLEPVPESIMPSAEPKIIPETVNLNPVVSKPIEVQEPIVPPIYFPPEPTDDKPSNLFKYLFYFSFLLFVGVVSAIIYNFVNKQQAPVEIVQNIPTSIPAKNSVQFCELNDKKIPVGESFASADSCNTCSCTENLTIICTQKACVSPTEVEASPTAVPTKKVSTKLYKDIKYGYQFSCPTTDKYQVVATSVDGNTIPFKKETCTSGESVTTISVYDNTVIHTFGNTGTQISPDKKYVIELSGDNDTIISSFKFL